MRPAKSSMPESDELCSGCHPGCALTWFHIPSIAFQTDEAPVIDSLNTCTCSRPGQAIELILLAIHTALGGSMNSRFGQRHVGSIAAMCKACSSPSIANG